MTTAEVVQLAIDNVDPEKRSARAFARHPDVNVNERTVRRWLSGARREIRDASLRARIERLAGATID